MKKANNFQIAKVSMVLLGFCFIFSTAACVAFSVAYKKSAYMVNGFYL